VAGVFASLLLSALAWPVLVSPAHSPAGAEPVMAVRLATAPSATLRFEHDKPVIVGTVADLFTTGSFEGPNEAEKTNRARPTPDGVTVSASFDAIRDKLAAIRDGNGNLPPVIPPVLVASLGAAPDSAALGAIDQVVPMSAPMPLMPTNSLAYARETTPATPFDLTVDKYGGPVSKKDIWCMAEAIYFESRGESYRGQIAVGQVVMNRLAHPLYPKDICDVVFQNQQMHNACQFSFACDGIPEIIDDQVAWKQANDIAKGVIGGTMYLPEVGRATHYHAVYVYPSWAPQLKRVAKIGNHIFYEFKDVA
jgi:spore germination cell wall hydrolase CwlJ-like protein